MTYQWKIPGLYGVDAQTAGEEMERIHRKHGQLSPPDIVEESRGESAPLHGVFEWRDREAAEKYRQAQARELLRAIVTVDMADSAAGPPEPVRAFVHVSRGYQPMALVVKRPEQLEELKAAALRDLKAFWQKYRALCRVPEFGPLLQAVGGTLRESGASPGQDVSVAIHNSEKEASPCTPHKITSCSSPPSSWL